MASLYPAPPPTTNTLDPVQRTQLLRSARKLGALLGTTPRVVEAGSVHALLPPLTPGTRALRREGKVFYNHSASSSTTTLSSIGSSLVLIPSSPDKQHQKNGSTPIAIELPLSGSEIRVPKHKKSKSSHHNQSVVSPQQPQLLYRLPVASLQPPTVAVPPLSLGLLDNITQDSVGEKSQKELTDSDRRRKMAKLSRTLGENIPPELVFGPPPRSSSLVSKPSISAASTTTATSTTPTTAVATRGNSVRTRRRRAGTGVHRPSTSNAFPSSSDAPPPLPINNTSVSVPRSTKPSLSKKVSTASLFKPLPNPLSTTTVTTSTTATTTTTTTTTSAIKQRSDSRRRPRSLTLTHVPLRGIIVEQATEQVPLPRGQTRSLDTPKVRVEAFSPMNTTYVVDYGRRKEKGWSGEWNVKDMEEVMKALRGLRG